MKKKNIIILGAVVILLIIGVSIIFTQQQSSTGGQKVIITPQKTTANTKHEPTLSLPVLTGTAKDATLQFYIYYSNSAQNPLAAGAFNSNPYLTSEFKSVISSFYDNGNVPIFCPQNMRKNVVVGQESTYYYDNGYLTSEIISDATNVSKNLFRVILKNMDGKWLIFDVDCLQ